METTAIEVKVSQLQKLGYGRFSMAFYSREHDCVFVFSDDYTKEVLLEFQNIYDNPYFPKIEKVKLLLNEDGCFDEDIVEFYDLENVYKMPEYRVGLYNDCWPEHKLSYALSYKTQKERFAKYYNIRGFEVEFTDEHFNSLVQFEDFLAENNIKWSTDFMPENVGIDDDGNLIFLDVFSID